MTQDKTIKPSTPIAEAWRKKMNESTLTAAEKAEATRVLIKLLKIRDKNKAEFDRLGLDHSGKPIAGSDDFAGNS